MTHHEETSLLIRVARLMFGPDVVLHPSALERARQIFRQWIEETNEAGGAA